LADLFENVETAYGQFVDNERSDPRPADSQRTDRNGADRQRSQSKSAERSRAGGNSRRPGRRQLLNVFERHGLSFLTGEVRS
jgi:hypothetical protein